MTIASVPAAAPALIPRGPKNSDQGDAARPGGKSRDHRQHGDGEVAAPQITTAAAGTSAATAVNLVA